MAHSCLFLCAVLSLAFLARADENDGEIWPYATFQTGAWQPPHLLLRTIGSGIDPGKIFMGVRNINEEEGTAPTIYDNNGDMVWQGPHRKSMDFKMQKLFGQDVITYWDGETGVLGYGYGRVHVLDNMYRNIYTITLQDDIVTPNGVPRESYVDVHEHLITPRNTMIVTAINITQMDLSGVEGGQPDSFVIDPLFYEIDIPTNQVLFKWDANDHQDKIPIAKSRRALWGGGRVEEPWDGYHLNSVHPTKDGYAVSIRFFWSVYYLNRDGSVRWQLSGADDGDGDFESQDVKFSWQHDARIYNENDDSLLLSVFNNAATRSAEDNQTTGLAIDVDLKNMKIAPLLTLADPAQPLISRTQGSFQFLGDPEARHVFIGYGSEPHVKEYDQDGNVILTAQFGGGKAQCYRAFKFPWHATPYYDPEIVVKHPTTYTTDVYMSWNGATDYDNWVVMSVPSPDSTYDQGTVLVTHERTGFETHAVFENTNAQYIMAVARQGDTVLRSSPIVAFAS